MLASLAVLVLAPQEPVGVWKGRLVVSAPTLPLSAPLALRLRQQRDLSLLLAARPTLTLRADRRYVLKNDGVPGLGPVRTKGVWSRKGSRVALVRSGVAKPRPFTLDLKDRKLTAKTSFGETEYRLVFVKS